MGESKMKETKKVNDQSRIIIKRIEPTDHKALTAALVISVMLVLLSVNYMMRDRVFNYSLTLI